MDTERFWGMFGSRLPLLFLLLVATAHARPTNTLVVYDELPTTLNPLYATTMADLRVY